MNVVATLEPKGKDGDEDEFNDFERVEIEKVCNGWVVKTTDSEGDTFIEVFMFDKVTELMDCFKEAIGID